MTTSRTRRPFVGTVAAAALVTTVALTLAGCAPGSSGTATTSGGGNASTTLTSKKVVLTIADETGFPLSTDLGKEFTKEHPNVTFKYNLDSYANLTANTPKQLASTSTPDIVRLPIIGDTVKDGLLANLDPYAKAYGWDKWSPGQLAGLRVAKDGSRGTGSLYQLGFGYSVTGIYMNEALAAKLGIASAPTTVADFEKDLATAKAGGVMPIMTGAQDGVVNFVIQSVAYQFVDKAKLLDWEFTKAGASFDIPGMAEGADKVAKWAAAGYFPKDLLATTYADQVTRFGKGEGLFTFNGSWAAADYASKMGVDKVSFFLFPGQEATSPKVAAGTGNTFSISARSKNIDTAAYFFNWVQTNKKARQIAADVTSSPSGGDAAQAQPKAGNKLIQSVFDAYRVVAKDDGQVDFLSNTTAGIYAGSLIPESQLLVSGKVTGKEFVDHVEAFYKNEIAG